MILDSKSRGFTLLELLIVIAIIAILSAILIFVLNPAETLRKGRDSQRISDLKTLHQALAFYITVVQNPDLDTGIGPNCDGGLSTVCTVTYSGNGDPVSQNMPDNPGGATVSGCSTANTDTVNEDSASVDSSGWLPVDFTRISDGSPIPRLPFDPNFSVADLNNPTESDYLYVYTCRENPLGYEINANLESSQFSNGGPDDRESTDGGNNNNLFEIGTRLDLLLSP